MFSANRLFIFSVVILLAGCRKEELPVKPMDRGEVITAQVDMGSDYKEQIYYSLSGNSIVSTNLKTDWDLAFESAGSGFHIRLNTAKWMSCYRTTQTDFNAVSDTSGYSAGTAYDVPSGCMDSTAIGDWQSHSFVYIIDRGYTNTSARVGYKKIRILSANANSYTIRYASLSGSNEQTITVSRQLAKNYTCFSMNTNAVANVEPDRENYDLLFTQFTHIYHNPFQTYLVVGILSNPNKVKAARISDVDFSAIQLSDTLTHPFSSQVNTIGFDWKTYNLSAGTYTVDPTISFIIKAVDGFYYKLHFTGFYNSSGLKGSPKFEFKKL